MGIWRGKAQRGGRASKFDSDVEHLKINNTATRIGEAAKKRQEDGWTRRSPHQQQRPHSPSGPTVHQAFVPTPAAAFPLTLEPAVHQALVKQLPEDPPHALHEGQVERLQEDRGEGAVTNKNSGKGEGRACT
eukprot:364170-Chlamydomonas_euryale.AAC.4